MTPKEQADDLFNKIYNTEHCGINHFPNKNYCDCIEMNMFQAKQCALIAVNYIIAANPHSNPFNTEVYSTMGYWLKVKGEIELL